MDFDVHQLDQFVLWGSAVTLLAILAVRVTSRAGLPSLLIYLLIGVALGEEGLGIQFEDAQVAHALGFAALIVILAEGGLTTPWADVRPSMRLGATLATLGVARVRRGDDPRGPLPPGPALGARDPARRRHLADRRGRGVLGAPRRTTAQTDPRRARGRVRPQRRARRWCS